jgi:peptidoglycan/LPS O-acetylase OafA/YrhL
MPDVTDLRDPKPVRDEAAEIERLQALWELPVPELEQPVRKPGVARTLLARVDERLGSVVAIGWLVFVASVFFEPAPQPGTETPVWAQGLIAGFFLALGTAGILALAKGGRLAFGAAFVAGLLGLGLAVGCMATDHHPGGWWAWELAATGVLTVLAVAGLRRSRGRSSDG